MPYLYQIHDRLDATAQVRGSGNVFSDLGRPDASRLLRGSFREYSVERLLRLLTVLDLSRPEAT